MYRHIITMLLALTALTAHAQKTVIEGTVLDAQGKTVDAYVTMAPRERATSSALPIPTRKDTTN